MTNAQNVKLMFRCAEAYRDLAWVSYRAISARNAHLPATAGPSPAGLSARFSLLPVELAAPMFVNEAFALELYLKCLYVLDHGELPKEMRTHNLADLFRGTLPQTQCRIRQIFDIHKDREPQIPPDAPEVPPEARANLRAAGSLKSIEVVLKESAETFKKWRYVFEELAKGIPLPCWLGCLPAAAAREVILERRPDFAPDCRLHRPGEPLAGPVSLPDLV